MTDPARDLLERTKSFAIQALRLCADLPAGAETGLIKRQLAHAATSVGANYRSARRARSRRDFIAKLSIVEEEADECLYWLDLLGEVTSSSAEMQALSREADELVAIVAPRKRPEPSEVRTTKFEVRSGSVRPSQSHFALFRGSNGEVRSSKWLTHLVKIGGRFSSS